MRKSIFLFACLLFFASGLIAQAVAIGTNTPAPSAALEVHSVTGAFILPRMTTAQRNALTPMEGMLIYNSEYSKFQGYGLVAENADQASSTTGSACSGSGCGSKWQSFSQASTGMITNIRMYVVGYVGCLPATITVKIHTGIGTAGTVVQTSSIAVQAAGVNVVNVPFHASVTGGTVYTIELQSPATGCNGGNDNVQWLLGASDTYLQGYAYCCSALMNQDFVFATYMGTFGWLNLY